MRISNAVSSCAAVLVLAAMPVLAQDPRPAQPRIVQAIDESRLVTLTGNTHPLARAEYDQGVAPQDLPMERVLLLLRRSPEQEASLEQLIRDQQDPGSARYHRWLTPQQFGEQFGPALEDTEKIAGWLTSQGFRVEGVANGRNAIEFSGTAAQVERALHTQIHSYLVNGQRHWANAQNPQIPAALSPVVAGIVSLHNFPMKAMHHRAGALRAAPGNGSPARASFAPEYTLPAGSGLLWGILGPSDFATIYNVLPIWNAGFDGTGQKIAVVGRSNIVVQDVRNFRSVFGLPAKDPVITLNGADPGTSDPDEEFENVSDVEWAGSVAKGAVIDLVVTKSTAATDGSALSSQYIVNNNVAPVLSTGYGNCEMAMTLSGQSQFYYSLWQQAATEGITVVVASGDGGAATCDQDDTDATFGPQVNGVASTPYDVAVGGTDFFDILNQSAYWSSTNASGTLESAKSYVPEIVWNDSCASPEAVAVFGTSSGTGAAEALCNSSEAQASQLGLLTVTGSGGGASGLYSKPSWQSGVYGIPTDGHRDVPDVSLFAGDGVWLHYYAVCQADSGGPCNPSSPGGLVTAGGGGTSFGAPAFAGIMALYNQKAGGPLGLANPMLYQKAALEYGGPSSSNTTTLQACNASLPPATGNTCVFYDVTAGNNDVPCLKGSPGCYVSNAADTYGLLSTSNTSLVTAYPAGTGYDLAAGLGTINAANLLGVQPPPPPVLTSTTTTVAASQSTIYTTGSTTLTATVTAASGSVTPTGSVTFLRGSTALGSATLSGSGGTAQATLPISGGSPLTIGANTITASYGGDSNFTGSSGQATVTVSQPTAGPTITAVENGASFQTGIAAATWVTIVGYNLSATTRSWQNSDFVGASLPTSLSGVSVTINGVPAYVEYISPSQINVLAPDDPSLGAVQVQVTSGQAASNILTAQKAQFSPALFILTQGYAVVQHADSSLIGKSGLISGLTTTPAAPGETVVFWATGFGPTSPALPTGQVVAAPSLMANTVTFTIGGVAAHVAWAGQVGSGLCQFNVTVPNNLPSGDAAVVAQVGGVQTQTGVLISVLGSVPAPQIVSVNPASAQAGTSLSLTISGSNLSGMTAVQFAPSTGITVSNVNASASQVTATVTIASNAPVGPLYVSVAATPLAGMSNPLTFTIQNPGTLITSLTPNSGTPGTTVSLSIAGNYLSGVTGVQFSPSTGITVNGVSATAAQVTASVTIANNTPPGQVNVSVTSAAGSSNTLPFTILQPLPQITSLTPTSGQTGTTVPLTISGNNLSGVTAVQFSPSTGITVGIVTATATQVTASVSIANGTPAGQVNVLVWSPTGTSGTLPFTIIAPQPPQISSLSIASGYQGGNPTITITGSNLSGGTAVQFSPSTGIAVSNVIATATQVTVTLVIDPTAPLGVRNLSVSTTAGTSNTLPFTILGIHDGNWLGTTSQNWPITLTINNNNMIAFSYSISYPTSLPSCGRLLFTGVPGTSIALGTGSSFNINVNSTGFTTLFSGTFGSSASLSGTLVWNSTVSGCVANGTVNWSATNQTTH